MKSFLKYPGGKYKLSATINQHLGEGKKLIEPFVGAGNVFVNTDYDSYLLNDINQDVIDILSLIKRDPVHLMSLAEIYFSGSYNNEMSYYNLRREFNQIPSCAERCALFLYLNRHGYNGLCRYNLKGDYNVPYGRYRAPYFPQKEIEHFHQKLKRATLISGDFGEAFRRARSGTCIYSDPPYFGINDTANFTAYSGKGFGYREQIRLMKLSQKARDRGIRVIISNHDLPISRELYKGAEITSFDVRRTIGCKGRDNVGELLAVYG